MTDPAPGSSGFDPWSRHGSGQPQGLGGYGFGPPVGQPPPAPSHSEQSVPEAQSPAPQGRAWLTWGAAGVLLVGAFVVFGFVWPGGGLLVRQTLNQSSVETGVASIITDVYRAGSVGAVDCPAGQEARSGVRFMCVVNLDDEPRRVEITVLNSRGDYEVGNPH
ncbi:DUF4333 domain-containing protein [Hoyosella sp. YIM 151337]|uniref:DUF4333 domain-containing protein n=1 Tax=Hoyosella sp. YIM 151337 TaxID=2992742 RepID=UPI002235F2AB|nr:DUF4333 domain-containing protein [Hoyosella sp. YIM 151337]MCW4353066.1 DUF4333 domain-containing protein [Hoyosella sp. YIM 151337]